MKFRKGKTKAKKFRNQREQKKKEPLQKSKFHEKETRTW